MSWYWPFGSSSKPPVVEAPQKPKTREDGAILAREFFEEYQRTHKYITEGPTYTRRSFFKKIDFFTPTLKSIERFELDQPVFIFFACYVFIWTRAYNNSYYNDGNYIHPNNDNSSAINMYIGSSDESEEEYRFQGFRETPEYIDYIYPRGISYMCAKNYTTAVRFAKKAFCKLNKLPYKWNVCREDVALQNLGYLNCVDMHSALRPIRYMQWFQQNTYEYRKYVYGKHIKDSYYDYWSYTNDGKFRPKKNAEDRGYLKLAEIEIRKVENFLNLTSFKLKMDSKCLKETDSRILVIKYLLKYQQLWYYLVGCETQGYIKIYVTSGFTGLVKSLETQTIDYLKMLAQTYIELYKRDIPYYIAKMDMCVLRFVPMTPLKKLALGEFDYINACFLKWVQLRYGKFVITRTNLLDVPVLQKYNEKKKKDPKQTDPLENVVNYFVGDEEDDEDLIKQKIFDRKIIDEEEIFKKTVKKQFNSFQLNFEKEEKILTHVEQNAMLKKRAEALKHLMPKEALAKKPEKKKDYETDTEN